MGFGSVLSGLISITGSLFVQPGFPAQITLSNKSGERICGVPAQIMEINKEVILALSIEGAKDIHGYSAVIGFDSAVLRFEGATERLLPEEPSFLESNGGKLAVFVSVPKHGSIEIAAAQCKKDHTTASSGNGILAYLKFMTLRKGMSGLRVFDAILFNSEGCILKPKIR